jgi:AbiV
MDLNIDELIVRPGMFVLAPDKRYRVTGGTEGTKLDIFKNKEAAEKIYRAYARCHNNAVDLISDAEILLAAGKYARSLALAIMAWEELGKSQIAADYYSGVLTEQEYKAAFKEHRVKSSYLNRRCDRWEILFNRRL